MQQTNMIVKDLVRYLSIAHQSTSTKTDAVGKCSKLNCKTHHYNNRQNKWSILIFKNFTTSNENLNFK